MEKSNVTSFPKGKVAKEKTTIQIHYHQEKLFQN